ARLAHLDRALHVHFDETPDHPPAFVAEGAVRRDRRGDDGHAVPRQQLGDVADAADVRDPVFRRVTETLREVLPELGAREQLHGGEPVAQLLRHEPRNRALARRGEPREPDREPRMPAHLPHIAGWAAYASIRTSATSGRENSAGGRPPALSSARTFVPERKTCS